MASVPRHLKLIVDWINCRDFPVIWGKIPVQMLRLHKVVTGSEITDIDPLRKNDEIACIQTVDLELPIQVIRCVFQVVFQAVSHE